ncbi:MAG: lysophospholipid acyltransferase family protein [Methylocystis sp.]
MSGVLRRASAALILAFARLVTGVRGVWEGCAPCGEQRIYFANHASHGDFVLIWSAIPRPVRAKVRPVAGADYWNATRARRFFVTEVFNAVLIERGGVVQARHDPLAPLKQALIEGDSLIIFPEGTRNTTPEPLLAFKSGLCHLARAAPEIPLVPVWIDNIGRVMPKGEFLPVPLLCRATFGAPIRLLPGEDRDAFIGRARAALLELRPPETGAAR